VRFTDLNSLFLSPVTGAGNFAISTAGVSNAIVSAERTRAEWRRFNAEGAELELLLLKTSEQRLEFVRSTRPHGVPSYRMMKYLDSVNRERITLGLEPYPN